MEGHSAPLSGRDIAAAFGWWRDAGVDMDFSDAPQAWLANEADRDAPPPLPAAFTAAPRAEAEAGPAQTVRIGGDPAQWPGTLAEFQQWWQNEPSLDFGQVRTRVPPRGQGLGAVLAHHVRLVGPERLIAFGSGILPLFGHDPAQSAQSSLLFNHEGGSTPLLPAFELAAIASRPARKARFWQKWLEFSGVERELDGILNA
jgi:DNA polymerase